MCWLSISIKIRIKKNLEGNLTTWGEIQSKKQNWEFQAKFFHIKFE